MGTLTSASLHRNRTAPRGRWVRWVGLIAIGLVATLVASAGGASAGLVQGAVVATVPGAHTPQVLDNSVLSIAQVGDRIVVAGSFTQVRDTAANGGTTFDQPYLFAFDPATGAVDRSFRPVVDGVVNAVLAGAGNTVYLGGAFSHVDAVQRVKAAQVAVADGSVTGFKGPRFNGAVNDLALSGGRLFLGGNFSTADGVAHGGLATLDSASGALDEYMGVDVAGHHNYDGTSATVNGAVGIDKFAISPDGSRLVAIGNFTTADGLPRDQAAMVLLQPGAAAVDTGWQTTRFTPKCFSWAYDSYVRDVDFSPDGSYFVIASTGGANAGSLCDSTSRWETTAQGQAVQPTWVDFAGGDTALSVAVSDTAVYVGGHIRWMNNSQGSDSAGEGAVPRPSLAALDPRNGIPLSWNPGRSPRGFGVQAMLLTADGLYIGSDTDYIGNRQYLRPKLAFFPLAGGATLPDETTATLPGNVYLGGPTSSATGGSSAAGVLYRVNTGGPTLPSIDGGPDWVGDNGATSPYRNTGSNAAGYPPSASLDGSVPAGTPVEVFDTERWDPADATEMRYSFPVATGTTVQVRLSFANRCTCTSQPGQRAFDVAIDGRQVLGGYDIVADVGNQVGTTKTFTVTSDGSVDISFAHEMENPMVNAIEVVEPDPSGATATPAGADDVVSRYLDGTTVGTDAPVDGGGLQWSKVRGAFMAGSTLFYGYPDSSGAYKLFRRTFDGNAFGEPAAIDPYNDPYWSTIDSGTRPGAPPVYYRGRVPSLYGELSSVGGMAYRDGRLYYTRAGHDQLYYRYFSPESGIVGADEFVAAAGGFSDVSGIFLSGDRLYGVSRSNGWLGWVPFTDGTVTGAATPVSGPDGDGHDWRAHAVFLGPGAAPVPPNQPPTASFTSSCTGLTCSFDATGATDPDGSVTSYVWDFGDGATATGPRVDHAFPAAGDHQVLLTVTDDDGATGATTSTVTVAEPPPVTAGIDLRGSAGTSARGVTSVSVQVPPAVRAGDGLVLVLSTNSAVTGAAPAGWTAAATQSGAPSLTTQVFSRVAAADDAGATVTVALSGSAKATLQVMAYAGTASGDPIATVVGATDTGGTAHTTPTATAAAGSWVLSVWSDKSAAARQFTAPSGVTERSNLPGVGTGDVATLVADSGAAVGAGQVGGLTATVGSASNRATMLTVVLAPGSGTPPAANQAPTAAFASSCAQAQCSFDGRGSTDPDGTVAAYAWDFGDGATASGPAATHTFATSGDHTVRLTVTDDHGATGTTTATVTVAPAVPAGSIGLRGMAETSARGARSALLTVPASVQAGDGLVLVLSTNSTVTGTAPAGFTERAAQSGAPSLTTQVFSRVAGAADAGSTLTVPLSGSAKVTLQLMAYSGTSTTDPVASITGATDVGGTAHTTPTATAVAGSWVLSVWSDKSADPRQWTPPADLAARSNLAGVGNGDIATLVADTGAAVAGGQVGGRTATVPVASNRATMLTLVLARA
jgi:PKD repeat protein